MLKAFLPAMIERNDGHIVSVASTAGYFGVPRLGAYCSSKAAALNLHYSLVAELAAADEGALGAAARARRAGRIGSTVVCRTSCAARTCSWSASTTSVLPVVSLTLLLIVFLVEEVLAYSTIVHNTNRLFLYDYTSNTYE